MAEKKTIKPSVKYAIIAIVTLLLIVPLCVGIGYYSIRMPDNRDWTPFGELSAGTYTTQEDCTAVFGASDIVVKIEQVNAKDVDGDAALALISQTRLLTVTVDGKDADVQVTNAQDTYGTLWFTVVFDMLVGESRQSYECKLATNEHGHGINDTLAFNKKGARTFVVFALEV